MNDLSRDTENANDPLGQIFDKQKEQDRMDALDLVKDIAAQAKEIGNSYDRLQAQNEVDKNRDELALAEAKKEYDKLSDEQKASISLQDFYENNKDAWYYSAVDTQVNVNREKGNNAGGMGSSLNKGIDAASSIIAGIISGDIIGGLAGASAPYLAEQIKKATTNADGTVNTEANLIAHAILGAAVAAAQGNSALAGAGGAASGEAIAEYIKDTLYGKDTKLEDLTEAQRQNISNLAQLATGLAAAAASGGSVSDAGTAASASKNAVENNFFGDNIYFNQQNEDLLASFGGDIDKYLEYKKNEAMINLPLVVASVVGPLGLEAASPAVSACLSNPLLCLNNLGMYTIDIVGGEAAPMGYTAGVGFLSTKLTADDIKLLTELINTNPAFAKKLEEKAVAEVTKELGSNVIWNAEKNTLTIMKNSAGKGAEGQAGNVIKGFSQTETKIINEAQGILDSKTMDQIQQAYASGQPVTVVINGRTIQYEPNLPGSGMTMFGENGFLIGPEAFKSQAELQKTLLHELYRLNTSNSASGVSGALASQETKAAYDFAEKASSVLGNK